MTFQFVEQGMHLTSLIVMYVCNVWHCMSLTYACM